MAEQRKNLAPWLLIGGGLLLILIWVAGVFFIDQPGSVKTPTPAAASQVQRVSLTDAKKAYDEGTATFVDVRDVDSYNSSHISGAISIPYNELTDRLDELDPESWIITYCT